jgi:transcriptional regulator with XRE-family HTH domain
MSTNETQAFGRQVRVRREALTLSQEALAAAAFGNPDRKSYVSALENGRLASITPATAKKLAQALEIAAEDVPAGLRWQDEEYVSPLEARLAALEDRLMAGGPTQEPRPPSSGSSTRSLPGSSTRRSRTSTSAGWVKE